MSFRSALLMTAAIGVSGCAATPLQAPDAANILLSRNAPQKNCKFVGEVLGSQGNVWTAEFTSDENLVVGARNKMRDLAYQLGANYVQIEMENQSHNTADHSSGGVYSSTVVGNAYRCPEFGAAAVVERVQAAGDSKEP